MVRFPRIWKVLLKQYSRGKVLNFSVVFYRSFPKGKGFVRKYSISSVHNPLHEIPEELFRAGSRFLQNVSPPFRSLKIRQDLEEYCWQNGLKLCGNRYGSFRLEYCSHFRRFSGSLQSPLERIVREVNGTTTVPAFRSRMRWPKVSFWISLRGSSSKWSVFLLFSIGFTSYDLTLRHLKPDVTLERVSRTTQATRVLSHQILHVDGSSTLETFGAHRMQVIRLLVVCYVNQHRRLACATTVWRTEKSGKGACLRIFLRDPLSAPE